MTLGGHDQVKNMTLGVMIQVKNMTLGVMIQIKNMTLGVMIQIKNMTLGVMIQIKNMTRGCHDPSKEYDPRVHILYKVESCGPNLYKVHSSFTLLNNIAGGKMCYTNNLIWYTRYNPYTRC